MSAGAMDAARLAPELAHAIPGLRLLTEEPMARHCSFRIGGPAALFAEPSTVEELSALRRFLWEKGVEPTVIGNGTNLLVADAGIRGVVVHIGDALGSVAAEGENRLRAGAGLLLSRAAAYAAAQSLSGLEFAHGIPGSVGGAVVMNAGAYGGEMQDVVVSVRAMNAQGEPFDFGAAALSFSYRHSCFSESGGDIVTSALLRGTPGDRSAIDAQMAELQAKRRASQPLSQPSAGSTFKRPQNGYAAALIDGAGLKGLSVGGAMVSRKHAGFIVNTGGATCADVRALMERVCAAVFAAYGVELEPEVRLLGD
ncbi:MAG: UDP-N-acetylmuramate dehydrogenase [Oscillospiraceae bacterium]|nr:UDP-N-acetylmuramate dehydrogenase [Oscillospiraceae bacterium]